MTSTQPPPGQAFDDLVALQAATLESRREVEAVPSDHAAWLKPTLQTEQGSSQVFELLERHMERSEYLSTIANAREHAEQAAQAQPDVALEQRWAAAVAAPDDDANSGQAGDAEAACSLGGAYVIVHKEEVLEAMGTFIAAYLARMPEARDLPPERLQAALCLTFQELRKGRVRQVWDWGRSLYRAAAVSYAAFSMYTNPWLAMAVMKATWAAARLLLGSIV